MPNQYYIYILASGRNGTLYIGSTNDVVRRIREHRKKSNDGFTKKYHVHALVYFEQAPGIKTAMAREKQIKHWNRKWKIRLIEQHNPMWKDLYPSIIA